MTTIAEPDLQATIQAWDKAAWSLAALALATSDDGPPELTAAAGELLAATGLTGAPSGPLRGLGTSTPRQIASQAAAPLHQASALVSGRASAGTPKATRRCWPRGTQARRQRGLSPSSCCR